MNPPTPEQLDKLPKWAQAHFADLERRTRVAETALREYLDNQTPSNIFYNDYLSVGDANSPKDAIKYIQTDRITITRGDIRLDVTLRQDDLGIDLQWDDIHRRCREVAMIPKSFQQVVLISKENMRK